MRRITLSQPEIGLGLEVRFDLLRLAFRDVRPHQARLFQLLPGTAVKVAMREALVHREETLPDEGGREPQIGGEVVVILADRFLKTGDRLPDPFRGVPLEGEGPEHKEPERLRGEGFVAIRHEFLFR